MKRVRPTRRQSLNRRAAVLSAETPAYLRLVPYLGPLWGLAVALAVASYATTVFPMWQIAGLPIGWLALGGVTALGFAFRLGQTGFMLSRSTVLVAAATLLTALLGFLMIEHAVVQVSEPLADYLTDWSLSGRGKSVLGFVVGAGAAAALPALRR